jgi:predicted DNA-binding transcriptional regulator YafY
VINEKRNNREKVIANKLNRLMYILRELDVKEEVFMEEIIKVTGVSKRTVLRDLKFLREMLIDKEIVFDEYQGSYIMKDLL